MTTSLRAIGMECATLSPLPQLGRRNKLECLRTSHPPLPFHFQSCKTKLFRCILDVVTMSLEVLVVAVSTDTYAVYLRFGPCSGGEGVMTIDRSASYCMLLAPYIKHNILTYNTFRTPFIVTYRPTSTSSQSSFKSLLQSNEVKRSHLSSTPQGRKPSQKKDKEQIDNTRACLHCIMKQTTHH